MLARNQLGQIFRLLLRIGPAADLVDAQIAVRAIAEANRGRSAADFLHCNGVFQIAKAKAAPIFFHSDAMQAQRTHFRP